VTRANGDSSDHVRWEEIVVTIAKSALAVCSPPREVTLPATMWCRTLARRRVNPVAGTKCASKPANRLGSVRRADHHGHGFDLARMNWRFYSGILSPGRCKKMLHTWGRCTAFFLT